MSSDTHYNEYVNNNIINKDKISIGIDFKNKKNYQIFKEK